MKIASLVVWLSVVLFFLPACVTWNSGTENEKPPAITQEIPLSDALTAGIRFGDNTLVAVKRLIKQRHEFVPAEGLLYDRILSNYSSWAPPQVINALHLYQTVGGKRAAEIFKILVRANTTFLHQAGWHLAASLPSRLMAQEVEVKLTEAISDNEVDDLFWPKMAEAVANNHLIQSYTLVRQGLHESNHVAFARAMIALNPRRASYDFMDYLARAPIEELRQLSLTSVDIYSCMVILEHYLSYPVAITHPRFEHLFFYTVSRNTVLADMSREALENYMPVRNSNLALQLSRMPTWVQVAFVEGTRRQMTPTVNVFLSQLKQTTSQREVIEEIDNMVR